MAKSFGRNQVLSDLNLAAWPGEILAIAGENGAGKSTLVKIIAGIHPAGSYMGEIRIHGEVAHFRSVAEAEATGVVIVPQELAIIPGLTVADNVYLNSEPNRWGIIDAVAMRRSASQTLATFGLDVDPDVEAGTLGVAQQQIVEIARAMRKRASILILDEPTAALTTMETELLFKRLKKLRSEGTICILYISHRLDEIMRIADRVVVLRDGRLVATGEPAELTAPGIVKAMVGEELTQTRRETGRTLPDKPSCLTLNNWTVKLRRRAKTRIHGVNFELRPGEVVGLLGAVGSGRSELLLSLLGAFGWVDEGTMTLFGEVVRLKSPREGWDRGIAFVAEDRFRMGLVSEMSVEDNLLLSSLEQIVFALGVISTKTARRIATQARDELRIVATSLDVRVSQLSGGNQQKVLLGRALANEPKVLLLDEPTRGVDVGAKAEIHQLLRRMADDGLGILMASSEPEEVLYVADRVLVLGKGRLVLERSVEDTNLEELVAAVTGVIDEDVK